VTAKEGGESAKSDVLSSQKSEQRKVAKCRVHTLATHHSGQAGSEVEPGYTNPQKSRVVLQLCFIKGMDRNAYRRRFSLLRFVIAKKELPHA